ncbi:hypothetical protein SDRG_17380, partial [Saprolegnia diclina VS20]
MDDFNRCSRVNRLRTNGSYAVPRKSIVSVANCVPNTKSVKRNDRRAIGPPNMPGGFCTIKPLEDAGCFRVETNDIGLYLPWLIMHRGIEVVGEVHAQPLYEFTELSGRTHSSYLKGVRLLKVTDSDFKNVEHAWTHLKQCLGIPAFRNYLRQNVLFMPGDYWAQHTMKHLVLIEQLPDDERRRVMGTWFSQNEAPLPSQLKVASNIVPVNGLLHISLTLLEAVCGAFDPVIRQLWPVIASKPLPEKLYHNNMVDCADVMLGAYSLLREKLLVYMSRFNTAGMDLMKHFFEHLLPLATTFYNKLVRDECKLDDLRSVMPWVAQAFILMNRHHYKLSVLEWICQIDHVEKNHPTLYEALVAHPRCLLDEYMIENQNSIIARTTRATSSAEQVASAAYRTDALQANITALEAAVTTNPTKRDRKTSLKPLVTAMTGPILDIFIAASNKNALVAKMIFKAKKWQVESITATFLPAHQLSLRAFPAWYHYLNEQQQLHHGLPCVRADSSAVELPFEEGPVASADEPMYDAEEAINAMDADILDIDDDDEIDEGADSDDEEAEDDPMGCNGGGESSGFNSNNDLNVSRTIDFNADSDDDSEAQVATNGGMVNVGGNGVAVDSTSDDDWDSVGMTAALDICVDGLDYEPEREPESQQ